MNNAGWPITLLVGPAQPLNGLAALSGHSTSRDEGMMTHCTEKRRNGRITKGKRLPRSGACSRPALKEGTGEGEILSFQWDMHVDME